MLTCRVGLRRAFNSFLTIGPISGTPILSATYSRVERFPTARQSFATALAKAERSTPSPDVGDRTDRTGALGEKEEKKLQWVVRKHLEHMTDPYKIAQQVEKTLERDRFEEALLLTKTASKDKQCVVAWNHLIGYLFSKQRLHAAIKLYNEMKKRAQLPNAQTFTIIFRGCANSAHPKLAVSEAIRLYHVLLNDKRLQPNTIHMNAVLKVCANARDIEAMFSIANTADDRSRAPSTLTYTILINALRAAADTEGLRDVSEQQAEEQSRTAIQRSKAIWEEVVRRWRNGKIYIDEPLVCAMGRVLLLGNKEDRREVFGLLEQTMSIPRLDGSEALPGTADELSKEDLDAEMKNIAKSGPSKSLSGNRIAYAVPGRNTLSLVLEIARYERRVKMGLKYWNLFIEHYAVTPDSNNWHELLRLLRTGKSSGQIAETLSIMPDEYKEYKTFRIALSSCVSDSINANVMKNAKKILDHMTSVLENPDPASLRTYLKAAMVSHYNFRHQAASGDQKGAKQAYGKQILDALETLEVPYKKCRQLLEDYEEGGRAQSDKRQITYNDRAEVIALARKMTGAYDKLLTERLVDPKEFPFLEGRRHLLNRIVLKWFEKRGENEPNLPRKRSAVRPRIHQEPDEQVDAQRDQVESEEDDFRPDPSWNTRWPVKKK